MTALDVDEGVKELWIVAESPRNRPQAADVLRMAPTGIVPTTVSVGDEGYGHSAPPASAYRTATTMSEQQDRSVLDAEVSEW